MRGHTSHPTLPSCPQAVPRRPRRPPRLPRGTRLGPGKCWHRRSRSVWRRGGIGRHGCRRRRGGVGRHAIGRRQDDSYHQPERGPNHARCRAPPPDTRPPPPDLPPDVSNETYPCPTGTVRIHVRDFWSSAVTPTMNTMTAPPLSVLVIDPTGSWPSYGARQDTESCSWYSVCAPSTLTKFQIKPVGTDACGAHPTPQAPLTPQS